MPSCSPVPAVWGRAVLLAGVGPWLRALLHLQELSGGPVPLPVHEAPAAGPCSSLGVRLAGSRAPVTGDSSHLHHIPTATGCRRPAPCWAQPRCRSPRLPTAFPHSAPRPMGVSGLLASAWELWRAATGAATGQILPSLSGCVC